MAWKRERRPARGGAVIDLPRKAIAADDSRTQAQAQARLLIEAQAEVGLDTLLGELAGDDEAQRKLVSIFERVTLPLVERIAEAPAERGR